MTAKELTALEDQLGAEQVFIKKYNSLAQQSTDPTIRTKMEQIASRHQQHYNTLLTHLK